MRITEASSTFQPSADRRNGEDDRIELRFLFLLLWRRKWLILLAGLLGAVLAFAMVSRITPKYTASAKLMLDPRTVQVLDATDMISELQLSDSVLDTEVSLLRSNTLLGEVVEGIDPALLEKFDPANSAPGTLDRLKRSVASVLENGLALLGLDRAGTQGPTEATPAADTEAARLRRLAGALKHNMRVWRDGQSYMIAVSVTAEDPALSARFANDIVETYVENQVEQHRDTVRGATDFLTRRVAEMRTSVEEAEAAVEDFRRSQLAENGVTATTLEQQLLELSNQLAIARADLATALSRYQRIRSVTEEEGLEVASELLSSPLVVSLREELLSLRRQDADLATTYGLEHPERQRLRASMSLLVDDLAAEVRKIIANMRNDTEVAQIRADSLQKSAAEIEGRVSEITRNALELKQLEREADANRSTYETVLDRLNETRSVQELQRADARVVEEALVPGAPSEPRVMLFTALGGTAGFMAGLILAFLSAISSTGFQRNSQLEQATGLPVFTSLPRGPWRDIRGMLKSLRATPYQTFAERLRVLRTTLKLLSEGRPSRTLLITSAVPGEGKTTTSVGLAAVESMAHRSSVIVDFDTRRSNLAQALRYAPSGGDLADLLTGNCELDDALYEVPHQGFQLLSVAFPTPQLVENTDPARIRSLLAALQERFDTVIIDTPPVSLVADTLILAQMADVVLLAVKTETTHRRVVTEAARRLAETGPDTVGLIMTMVDPRDEEDTYMISTEYNYGVR